MRSITVFNAIKRITNTEVLDDLIKELINKKSQINQTKDERTLVVTEFPLYHFVNTVMINKKTSNFLINIIIYNSECNYFLTYNKTRFRDEIWLAKTKSIDTFDDKMQVVKYEIMIIKNFLHDQMKKLFFSNIAYISFSKFTLILTNKLKRKKFI